MTWKGEGNMERKTYAKPTCEAAEYGTRHPLLLTISSGDSIKVEDEAEDDLEGMSNVGGGFSDIWGNGH